MISEAHKKIIRKKARIELLLMHLVHNVAEDNCNKRIIPSYNKLLKALQKRVEQELEEQ